ncbi:hypothetical protein [Shewanella sp.]|uniref:hypothetical protein n=1 Tax=Shewanella sp. TaxID=50422 RepID=UPI003A96A64F
MKNLVGVLLLLFLAACDLVPNPANNDDAGNCEATADYQLELPRMDETLQQIAHGTGCFIEADLAQIGAIKPKPVIGHYSIRAAVEIAIAGTGLESEQTALNNITVTEK